MTAFHDFIAAVAAWGRRRRRQARPLPSDGLPTPAPREDSQLLHLRDDQLRLYCSTYGQHLLRRELQRRRQAR